MDTKPHPQARFPFYPFIAPFRYVSSGQWITDANGQLVLDVRGWGYLTGQGAAALKLPEDQAAAIQDRLGKTVAALMNRAPNLLPAQPAPEALAAETIADQLAPWAPPET